MLRWATSRLPIPPVQWSTANLVGETFDPLGFILMVPLSGQQMLDAPRHEVLYRIEQAVEKAVALGADVVGLGALTSPATQGGQLLSYRKDVSITNGNAFTAAMMFEAVLRLIELAPTNSPEVALVGATGSVASCLAGLLAAHGTVERLQLIARNEHKLKELAQQLASPSLKIKTATSIDAASTADVVVLLTASADNLLESRHLKHGAVVLDGTQPRNTRPELVAERPDVLVIDGGWVAVPGVHLTVRTEDWPLGCVFACLAETMLLALDGHRGHFSMGAPTVDQAEHTRALARRFEHLGFALAPFHSFGKPLPLPWLERRAEAAKRARSQDDARALRTVTRLSLELVS